MGRLGSSSQMVFSYRSLVPGNKYFKNYGYPVAGAMKGKLGIISITYGGPMLSYQNFSIFDNIPFRKLKLFLN